MFSLNSPMFWLAREPPLVVAITGASGYVGKKLLQTLGDAENIDHILALDSQPLGRTFPKVTAHQVDIAHLPARIFADHQASTVMHLAFHLRPGWGRSAARMVSQANQASTEAVLRACERANAPNLIFLSSHAVYGAHAHNPAQITEDSPVDPLPGFQYAVDKAACEEQVLSYAQKTPDAKVTILRSCVALGPGADNYVTRAMFKPLLLRLWGYDPLLQYVHEDDLSELLRSLVTDQVAGIFNVAGNGTIPYSRAARLASCRMAPMPVSLAYPLVQLAWNLGIQKNSPAVGLEYIRHPIVLSTQKLLDCTGFRCSYTSEEALRSCFPGRP